MKTESTKEYTIAEILNFTKLSELDGKQKTGMIDRVKYKIVKLAHSETFGRAVVVSWNGGGGPLEIICDPPKIDQFLYRGC